MEINEEDEKALAAFMSKDKAAELTLGDIILQKIREKDAEVSAGVYSFFLELLLFPSAVLLIVVWIVIRSFNCKLFLSSSDVPISLHRRTASCEIGQQHS